MDNNISLNDLRKFRLDIETQPFLNNQNQGIALFDLTLSFVAAYILDRQFKLSNRLGCNQNSQAVFYMLVIPFGILVHYLFSMYQQQTFTPTQMTFLNRKIFTPNVNIYQIMVFFMILYSFMSC